ncbi:MAG: hypothetical protein WAW57_15220 [Lutibacter sp.]
MSEFLTTITYLKDTLTADTDVNVVTHGTSDQIDLDKKTTFPLAHIQITNSEIAGGYISFTFEIHALKLRDISKAPITDKWIKNDNELDNLDTCFNILNRLITGLRLKQNIYDIELLGATNPEPITLDFMNMLDGWKTTLQLQISNNVTVC